MTADDKLSHEDRALWRSVTRSIAPLKRKHVSSPDAGAAPARRKPLRSTGGPSASIRPAPSPKASPQLVPIDRRLKARLARGLVGIDARLDLHGRTQSEAHAALLRFLRRMQRDGARTVLVITGKGVADERAAGRGVLKRQVPLWLGLPEFRAYVLGIETAHAAHGGAGALYVRLRRGR